MQRAPDLDVVDLIYETIEDPNSWPKALAAIAQSMDASGGFLMLSFANQERIAISSPSIETLTKEYMTTWAKKDIRSNRIEERNLFLTKDTIVDSDVVTTEEMDNHEYYVDFLAKYDLRYFCASVWNVSPNLNVGLGIQRSKKEGLFSLEDQQHVMRFGRHIERAMRLRGQFSQERMYTESLEMLTLHSQHAVLIVTFDGEVKFANLAAGKLPADIASITASRLNIGAAAQRDAIFAAIQKACAPIPEVSDRLIFIPGNSTTLGYAVSIIPRPRVNRPAADHIHVNDNEALAVVAITPIKANETFDPVITRDYLGVTLGEARVAALIASGMSPREISMKLGLTEETVRVTLKQVYRKTGLNRQNELAAAIHALRSLPRALHP